MNGNSQSPLVFLIAGESSADALGAALMAGLKARTEGDIRFEGVGGPLMTAEGLESLFPMEDLALMGLAEVFHRVPAIIKRLNQTVNTAIAAKPDAVVTIDSPDFCFRVAKRLKKNGVRPLVHYVAPTVWAWRRKRARKVAAFLDHLLCLFPFEPKYFKIEGLNATFVGHPVFHGGGRGDALAFREAHGIPEDVAIVSILPGSRHGEIKRHLPIFLEAVDLIKTEHPTLRIVLPTVPHVATLVKKVVADSAQPVVVVEGEREKRNAFSASTVALATSGTVSLELAVAGVPTVIAYKMKRATFAIAKRLVKVRFASLVNIVEDREIVPEFIQGDCTAEKLAEAVNGLLMDKSRRLYQKDGFQAALKSLGGDGETGGTRAAEVILSMMAKDYRKNGTRFLDNRAGKFSGGRVV